jgi:hypothetical protein
VTDHSLLRVEPRDSSEHGLGALEQRLTDREREVAALKRELLQLQADYFRAVGALYAELDALETAVVEGEVRAGLRSPPNADAEDSRDSSSDPGVQSACSNRGAASADLKRVFRDLAKAIHPDRAADGAARYRRHSLMAEANRAYAERDRDRLLLILRAWERSPESVPDHEPDAPRLRGERRVAQIRDRLVAIDGEFADLRASAIWRLKTKMDDARTQGWDLFAEIVLEVKRQISRTRARLVSLRHRRHGAR